MPEGKDVDKKIHTVKKPDRNEDIYEGIESHSESERNEDREGGPEAPMRDLRGPIILTPSTYVEEDEAFDRKKLRAPGKKKKK